MVNYFYKSLLITLTLSLMLLFYQPAFADAFIRADVLSLSTNAMASDNVDIGELSPHENKYHIFPYYMRIEFPDNNFTAWGIQLYTDNNPNQSWVPDDGYSGGLRGKTDPGYGIPLKWQVYDTLQDAAPAWGTANSITRTAGGLAFNESTLNYWGRVYDRHDNDVTDENAWRSTEFVAQRTIANYDGLGNYPQSNRMSAHSPVYLYFGLDLSSVKSSQDYGGTIKLDLYNLSVSASHNGYATPNPFTPSTGQSTKFNFFVENTTSSFEINIYTLRGRKIRRLTDTKEWDGRNEQGKIVEGGVYLYQIEAEGNRTSGTVVLLK